MTTLLALALAALVAPAGQDVKMTRSVAADARIHVESGAGSLRIEGWDRAEVSVTGTACDGAEGLEVRGGERSLTIDLGGHGDPRRCSSDILVKVPAGSTVDAESLMASISASGLTGTFRAESVHGGLRVGGRLKLVELDSVAGNVEFDGSAGTVRAESVNGSVFLRGVSGDVEAGTVTGLLSVTGSDLRNLRLETVSGALRFAGSLAEGAQVTAESVSGAVDLTLAAGSDVTIDASSFSGAIVNDLSADRAAAENDIPGLTARTLRFSLGRGSAQVSVETVSGRIRLTPAGR